MTVLKKKFIAVVGQVVVTQVAWQHTVFLKGDNFCIASFLAGLDEVQEELLYYRRCRRRHRHRR